MESAPVLEQTRGLPDRMAAASRIAIERSQERLRLMQEEAGAAQPNVDSPDTDRY